MLECVQLQDPVSFVSFCALNNFSFYRSFLINEDTDTDNERLFEHKPLPVHAIYGGMPILSARRPSAARL